MTTNKQNEDRPIRKIRIILRMTLPNVITNKFTWVWMVLTLTIVITWGFFPQVATFNSLESFANQVIGFLGLTLALIALRAYDIGDLAHLYLHHGKSNKDAKHALYYKYIGEFYLAITLWALACIGMFVDAIIDFSCFANYVMNILHIAYTSLLLANILSIINLFFSTFDRLTNKVILEATKISKTKKLP